MLFAMLHFSFLLHVLSCKQTSYLFVFRDSSVPGICRSRVLSPEAKVQHLYNLRNAAKPLLHSTLRIPCRLSLLMHCTVYSMFRAIFCCSAFCMALSLNIVFTRLYRPVDGPINPKCWTCSLGETVCTL
jgi:hypothetical protein